MRYSFNRSPSKDLQAINAFLREERPATKRLLSYEIGPRDHVSDAAMAPPPPKFAMTVENAGAARKISFHWKTFCWHFLLQPISLDFFLTLPARHLA